MEVGTYTFKEPLDYAGQEPAPIDYSARKPEPLRNFVGGVRAAQGYPVPEAAGLNTQAPNRAVQGPRPEEERGRAKRNGAVPGGYPQEYINDDPEQPYDGLVVDPPPRTTYDPADTNQDGIVSEVERYLAYQQQTPDQRKQAWIEHNVWAKGYTVDAGTGEIVDARTGQAIGVLPKFE